MFDHDDDEVEALAIEAATRLAELRGALAVAALADLPAAVQCLQHHRRPVNDDRRSRR